LGATQKGGGERKIVGAFPSAKGGKFCRVRIETGRGGGKKQTGRETQKKGGAVARPKIRGVAGDSGEGTFKTGRDKAKVLLRKAKSRKTENQQALTNSQGGTGKEGGEGAVFIVPKKKKKKRRTGERKIVHVE